MVDLEAAPQEAHIVEAVAVEDGSAEEHKKVTLAPTQTMEPLIIMEDMDNIILLDPTEAEIPKVSSGARQITTMG